MRDVQKAGLLYTSLYSVGGKAGVTLDVTLRLTMYKQVSMQARETPWLWNPWGGSHKVQNRGNQWPHKMELGPTKNKKERNTNSFPLLFVTKKFGAWFYCSNFDLTKFCEFRSIRKCEGLVKAINFKMIVTIKCVYIKERIILWSHFENRILETEYLEAEIIP